jgi:hypothetical protein
MPGEVVSKNPSTEKRGVVIHMIYCRTEGCRWQDTSWIVQVNADGSIPPPIDHSKRPDTKNYPKLRGPDSEEERVLNAIQRQIDAETKPGAEVRNPHGR